MNSTSTLRVRTAGSGPDLALLHGWGFDGNAWGDFSRQLAERFRVHQVDLPGHGHSRGLPFADLPAVAALVAEAIPRGATVCGWSLGGLIALQLALSDPGRVARLALVSTTPSFVTRDDWHPGMPTQTFEGFGESLALDRDRTLRRFAGLVANGSARHRDLTRQLVSMARAANPDTESLSAALRALGDTDMRPDVSSVTVPTLLVHGDRDGLVPVAAARWLASRLAAREPGGAGARLEVLPDASHAPFLDAPERVAHLISAWHG